METVDTTRTEPRRAVRIDEDAGIREEVEHFGSGPEKMLGFLHRPLTDATAGVVICSPILSEQDRNYRREVLIARALAPKGFAVARFHYRGSGDSDGTGEDLTYDQLTQDAQEALEWLLRRTGVDRVAFVGTRLGAMVAATISRPRPGAPLVLLDPVVDGKRWVREVFRARQVWHVKRNKTDGLEDARSVLDREGVVDVAGYAVHRSLCDSLDGRTLAEELGDVRHPFLVVGFTRSGEISGELKVLGDRLSSEGSTVELASAPQVSPWWLGGAAQPHERKGVVEPAVVHIRDWLARGWR